jgi:cytidine deaminase
VIDAPFRADATVAARLAELGASIGAAVEADVAAIVSAPPAHGSVDGSTVPASEVARLVARHGLASERELALLALPVAAAMAGALISGYQVPAIGIEAESGDLVLGANLEFPGTDLGTTVHAEGFVALRARRRGRTLETLAVREAHPCAHCRQTLAEAESADRLEIIDPLGHELTLGELYPWPFRPAGLGVPGDRPEGVDWPRLALAADAPAAEVADALLEAGRRAHAPYSGVPSAVALRLLDGRVVSAGCVESVAFNPTLTALQAALVEVVAARAALDDITHAWLARTLGGPVDPGPAFEGLLAAVAPEAEGHVLNWRTGA